MRITRFAMAAVIAVLVAMACGDDGGNSPGEAGGAVPDGADGLPGYRDHQPDQYAGTANWICHPALPIDACRRDLDTTVIEPDGASRVERFEPAITPAFDCFYVYPTTSTDPEPVSDLAVDDSEITTVRAQVARFSSVCRVFAPAYRQVTIAGLNGAPPQARELAYRDVVDAWRTYVVEANQGRGVVLVGHSQGATHLRRLLAQEFDYQPELRELLVSAVLLGTSVQVDAAGGGVDLRNIPPCISAEQTACVISFVTYPDLEPLAADALFGRSGLGRQAVCSDPADLLGVDGPVGAVMLSRLAWIGGVEGFEDVTTPFVSLPQVVNVACTQTDSHSYLAVGLADLDDPRQLDGLLEQHLGPGWGLHLIDGNIAQDELIEIVAHQAATR